jgi:glycosyltransferase involved in cell wall biosynthesis
MNLSICHYHLQPGGVTRIIQSQIQALTASGCVEKIQIITGHVPEQSRVRHQDYRVHPRLNYLPEAVTREECLEYGHTLLSYLGDQLGQRDILHVHNPNLGKNPVLTYVLFLLSQKGFRLFYHCHDFAEDRMPNMAFNQRIIRYFNEDVGSVLYPPFPNCHFGVLNSRDFDRLKGMGIEPERIKYLPNPVGFKKVPAATPDSRQEVCNRFNLSKEKPIILYPVRVIRRKNIGEFILLASVFREDASWLVTLAPHNPVEKPSYLEWKGFAEMICAPVLFEMGHRVGFHVLMDAADRIITTSRQEGFGMSYLEPWMFDKPVVGRKISYVIRDFLEEGMEFPSLYDCLSVPDRGKTVDFADLPPSRQRSTIERLLEDQTARESFIQQNRLKRILFGDVPKHIIQKNRRIIEQRYSLESYGKRLCSVYSELLGTAPASSA